MDVFISYEHESKSIADNIVAVLESKGVRCWYAPRDVYGDYATSIVEAIERCKAFVLILSHKSSESPHVLNEVEMAYQRILQGELVIVPFKVDEGVLSKAMEYYIKRLHWIDAASSTLEQSIVALYEKLAPILGLDKQEDSERKEDNTRRKNNQYYDAADMVEINRLKNEEELLFEYEKPFYDKLFFGKNDLNVLDFNTLSPKDALLRLNRAEVGKLVCLSYNDGIVQEGKDLTADMPNVTFEKIDYVNDDVETALKSITLNDSVSGFDFVNLSMAIMDFENPFKILKKIKKFMKPGAVMFVRDVDDGVVFAYPDNDNLFSQFKEFYKMDDLSGSRNSGRQIYNILKKLGAKSIRLENCSVNTSNMDYDKRRLLFESWFSFIPNDFSIMAKKNPENKSIAEVNKWLCEHYDDLEEAFFNDDFLFNSGYVIYTARF